MRLGRSLTYWIVLIGLTGSVSTAALAQEVTGEAVVEADDPRAEIRLLKERLETVERRLAESEAKKSEAAGAPETFVGPPGAAQAITPSWMPTEDETFVAAEASPAAADKPKTASKPADPLSMSAKWKNGLELETADKQFRVHIGGRTQIDMVFFQGDSAFDNAGGARSSDAVNFRRARLRADGTMYGWIDWCVEYDFVNGANVNLPAAPTEATVINTTGLTDAYFIFKDVPFVGNIKAGLFKDPIGMEHNTSSRYLEFMERSYIQDAFTGPANNGFIPGVMIFDNWAGENGTWASGFFKNTTNPYSYGIGGGEYSWASRVTYLPVYECNGDRLLHVGMSGNIRDLNDDLIRFRTRPALRNGPGPYDPVIADTGTLIGDNQGMLGGELAANWGPLSLQGEFFGSWVTNTIGNAGPFLGVPLGTTYVYGWYAEALYFLTGETRYYDRKAGLFARTTPKENFRFGRGLGAWQIGARYSKLYLRDTGIDGGVVDDVTLGVNWYLNPNLKLQANYVVTHGEPPAIGVPRGMNGTIQGFGMRLAHDF